MKLFLKMYKLRELQISHNRPDNPSAASQHGRAREVRCVTRRRPAAVSGTARAYTLRPAVRPLEERGRRCRAAARSCTAFTQRVASSRHLPVTMRQASLCRVRPTGGVVTTHRCAPPPAARDRPVRLRGRCAANRDGGALAAAWGQTVRASQPRRHSTPLASAPRGRSAYGGGEGEGEVPCNKKIYN